MCLKKGNLTYCSSCRLLSCFDVSSQAAVKSHVNVIRNFLNYLLHHDVCPEYAGQIEAAKATCNLAEVELWNVHRAAFLLPGSFNKACSTIFGGHFHDTYIGDPDSAGATSGVSYEHTSTVIKAGLAAQGNKKMCEKYNEHVRKEKARIKEDFATGFEVIEIEVANEEVEHMYRHPSMKSLEPLGKIRAKTWYNPSVLEDDLTEEEEADRLVNGGEIRTFEFWIEVSILQHMFKGMRIEAHVYRLSFGVWYFDSIIGVYPSFLTLLPNDDMIGWREHKYLEPRPTVGEEEYDDEDGLRHVDDGERGVKLAKDIG
jgi:Argonaute siRNA chaperone (ARC) complex subunit Arb1